MNPQDYDEDGNNIVPCPICGSNYCPSKFDDNTKCPEEDDYVKWLEERDRLSDRQICPQCAGDCWTVETEAIHGCDGTEEVCAQVCPVPRQVQVQCNLCKGEGNIPA